jgi:hypothetical protein
MPLVTVVVVLRQASATFSISVIPTRSDRCLHPYHGCVRFEESRAADLST